MLTGDDIKNARRKIGKTQEELADEIDFSPRQLSRIENNKSLGKYGRFLQLVEKLGLYEKVQGKNEGESAK